MVGVSRRGWIKGVMGCSVASGFVPRALAAHTLPIIDTHQHLWDLSKLKLAWATGDPLLDRNYGLADYRAATVGLNVERAVYMEVDVSAGDRKQEAEIIENLLDRRSSNTVAAVVGGNPGDEGFRAYVDRFKEDHRIKGVRCVLPPSAAGIPRFVEGVRYLGEIGWRFDLRLDSTNLMDAVDLAAACPNTHFVLDHCGNATTAFYAGGGDPRRKPWEVGLAALADRPNVVCKISGVCEAGPPGLAKAELAAPIVDRCIDRFGPDRVLFAGNWPVCLKAITLRDWVATLQKIVAPRGPALERKLFYENAVTFYELGDYR